MKKRNMVIFILIIAIVGSISFGAINGVKLGKYKIPPIKQKIQLGLDLAGGVYVVLEAQTKDTGKELEKKMEQTKAIITQRVDSLGVAEPNIVIEGKKRIRVELAGIKNSQEAIDLIGKTAQLQFVDPQGKIVVTGKNVKESDVGFQQSATGKEEPVVSLRFDKEGAKKFEEATKALSQKTDPKEKAIFIVVDDKVISSPIVQQPISDGKAVIQGSFDVKSATELANLIRAGALPVELKQVQTSVIGPTLGLESLDKSILAGAIGLLITFLFMIVMYRVPGFIADICLTIYILLTLSIMIGLDVKLTLPGIAGLILSIGMAVDANILIFERIKEELKAGKSLRMAVDSGFKRALTSVIDSNITTLIAGTVLYYLGTGPIKGFGVTLIIGLCTSMITAVFVTKFLLKLTVNTRLSKNTKLFGA